jgi:outer membrane receptor for ferrienterochelin and colicin
VGKASRVTSRIPGWDRRRDRGGGHAITHDEIEHRRPAKSVDLLRPVPGVRLLPGRGGDFRIRLRGEPCQPMVYVDGVQVMNETPAPAWLSNRSGSPGLPTESSIFSSLNPGEIEAIEVFTGASQVPPEFNATGSKCGVILVWLRRGP